MSQDHTSVVRTSIELVEVAARTWFVRGAFVHAALFETDEGLVMVDTCFAHEAPSVLAAVRRITNAPLHTVVFTHGHIDHAFGLAPWLTEASTADPPRPRPRIVAHELVPERFRRYARTAEYNGRINAVQFQLDQVWWPDANEQFAWPDVTYADRLELTIGGEVFQLNHARAETDDVTWVWVPGRAVLAVGDLVIGSAPNAGNPQKVQRYPEGWAGACRAMADLGARVLLPGHGPWWEGVEPLRRLLIDQAEYLEAIVEQTLAGLNAGLPHDEIVAALRIPEHLASLPHLQPLYDRPEFIARNVIRLYGGWWDGRPASLLPPSAEARAREVVALAGGVTAVVDRARALAGLGVGGEPPDMALACQLAEWAALACPDSRAAQECQRDVFTVRAQGETSLMGRGIFTRAVTRASAALAAIDE